MTARTPAQANHQVIAAINAGDIEAALALYEPGATFVAEPGKPVTGTAAIREVMAGFLSMKPSMTIEVPIVVEAGDTALMHSHWTLKGTGPDGSPVDNPEARAKKVVAALARRTVAQESTATTEANSRSSPSRRWAAPWPACSGCPCSQERGR